MPPRSEFSWRVYRAGGGGFLPFAGLHDGHLGRATGDEILCRADSSRVRGDILTDRLAAPSFFVGRRSKETRLGILEAASDFVSGDRVGGKLPGTPKRRNTGPSVVLPTRLVARFGLTTAELGRIEILTATNIQGGDDMERQLIRVPVIPGAEARLTPWIQGLDARRAVLEEVLRAEGIDAELVALDRSGFEAALLIYTSGPSLAASSAAFARSQHPVDVEMKQLRSDCLRFDQARVVEVLLAWP
jgi:Family of unknown function (DUF6176)